MRPRIEHWLKDRLLIRVAMLSIPLLFGCANVTVQPLTTPGSGYRESPEEIKLLARASNAHQELVSKGFLLRDESAVAFVQRVGESVVTDEVSTRVPITFHILRSANKNALASPSGNIYVTVGLLVSLESEGQLAYVLAHEVAHIAKRHMFSTYLTEKEGWKGAIIGDIFLLGTKLSYFPYIASLAAYSRERELEADDDALIFLESSGYPLGDAASALNHLKEPESKSGEIGWLSTHPALKERTDRILIKTQSSPSTSKASTEDPRYLSFRTGLLWEAIRLNLYARRYDEATRLAQRATEETNDKSRAYYFLGESKRLAAMEFSGAENKFIRRNETESNKSSKEKQTQNQLNTLTEAINAYEIAKKLDPNTHEADKGLGISYALLCQHEKSIELLTAFISKNPTDRDNQYIKRIISEGETKCSGKKQF